MTELSIIDLLSRIAGPLLGAGAGSYFGLKSALNGMRERQHTILRISEYTRDTARDVKHEVIELRRDVNDLARANK